MNILFLHNNFPGQFKHLAEHLARCDKNSVVFISNTLRKDMSIKNVTCYQVKGMSKVRNIDLLSATDMFQAQLTGSIYYGKALSSLKEKGFFPDIIFDHAGWGNSFFVKDIFPTAIYCVYCEWFFTKQADFNFLYPGGKRPDTDFARGRLRNLCQLNALLECDVAITPTKWQQSQYPARFQNKFHVLHDGIDTTLFQPSKNPAVQLKTLTGTKTLSNTQEIITYTARGLEPYRGFSQFYHALPKVLAARPECHVIIMGHDKPFYSPPLAGGQGLAEQLRRKYPLDESRVHFLDFSSYTKYLQVLQISSVHVYLTIPYVLSWSMLEAMSCGCLLVASSTEPVMEFINDGVNGLLTNFWDSEKLADKIIFALKNKDELQGIRQNARETILQRCDVQSILKKYSLLIQTITQKNTIL